VIKLYTYETNSYDALFWCARLNLILSADAKLSHKSKQELIVKALENEGLFNKAEVEESLSEQPMN